MPHLPILPDVITQITYGEYVGHTNSNEQQLLYKLKFTLMK